MKTSLRALVTTAAVALALSAAALPQAHAAPESSYPKAVMTYVKHPAGFPDSTEVTATGPVKYYSGTGYRKSLVCNIPTSAATSGDVTVSVRRELAPLVGELMRQTESKYGYDIRRGVTGGFNCRYIKSGGYERPDKGPSNHAYGRAVDINWDANPQSYTFRSDIPPAVVALWMRHGFYWGGHYSYHDTMHFEYVGSFSNINSYYAHAVAERGGTVTPPPSTTCPSYVLASYPTVQTGSSGTAVKVVQCRLRAAGNSLTADGSFGSATKSAVISFQSARGLTADGVVGPKTWTALLAYGTQPTLKSGSSGGDVTRLQAALRARGYTIAVDGSFGSGTASVVKAYQTRVGLTSDGIVGPNTWTALQRGR